MNSILTYIDNLDVGVGETRRINCPSCKGYKTFTVTNNMGRLLWNCYKASCNISGAEKKHLNVEQLREMISTREEEDMFFSIPEYIVDFKDNVIDFIVIKKYQEIYRKYCMHDIREDRAVFKIYDKTNVLTDAVGRSIFDRLPKWKRYGKSKVPYIIGSHQTSCVIVEDCISACVAAEHGVTGLALLGTSLLDEYKPYIAQYKTVIIALDPDAIPKTLQIAKELRGFVDNVKVLKLQDDIKYAKKKDINNLKEMAWN